MHLDMARDHCYDDDDDGDDQEEEGYIDMDVSSAAAKEFEFQMVPSRNLETGHSYSASPADEIFYKGKLLPLHLPPRLQMVETLLLQKPDGGSTPFASCDVSPATSCYVSGELDPEGFFFFEEEEERSGSSSPKEGLAGGPRTTKGSWARKLRSIKQSSLGLKLKASKAYIQSLFAAKPSPPAPKPKERSKSGRLIKRGQKEAGECGHRRSFSGTTVSKRRPSSSSSSSSNKSSSSCSSSNSSSFSSLKRSSSVSSDKECSIQGAIAYCKRSQQVQQASLGRKSVSDVESYLKSEPTGIDADAEREGGKRERRD